MRVWHGLLIALGLGVAGGLYITAPAPLDAGFASGHTADTEAGALVFAAAGCASCHTAPDGASEGPQVLAGGHAFASDFGTFYAPNISPDPASGIGAWDLPTFARAVTKGVSPDGAHYYPAFPYASYQNMTDADVADLFAYMQTLPASAQPNQPHDVGFPFNIRRGLGLWKVAFMPDGYVTPAPDDPVLARGRYLAEGLAHCAECHAPRNAVGALQTDQWMAGAPNPSGKGRVPNITPAALDWSESDLIEYFTSGFTPDYDSAGGEMVEVIENLSQLPEVDRAALAAYVAALPPIPSP
ncbi:cytochrome c family protein [uncultured Tateyamaria sp.]|uniref:c-type cytochrome n=1 Tax=uncultured Tateyamaria sp. TaxID=455651 RepID=UPI0026232342|nr:cytochrome c [uncultured Tateyamaria sp.]